MSIPRLRDSKRKRNSEPFPLNQLPIDIVKLIGGHLVYLISVGRNDITGSDWGDALASAIGGKHLSSPLGIADVVLGGMAWSTKTVKFSGASGVFSANRISLISGRCSPDYSYGITDPHTDIQKTGNAVLSIWNERVNIAQESYSPVRTSVLVRSQDMLSYTIFEEESHRYRTSDYEWRVNQNGNLKGFLRETEIHMFTWQPHGSQFTIHAAVPASATRFSIRMPPIIPKNDTLKAIGFEPSWVIIHP